MTKPQALVLPVVHHNGSGRVALMEQQHKANMAVNAAITALLEASPHARDYYPLGDDVWFRAHLQSMDRVVALQKVQLEIEQIYQSLLPFHSEEKP